MLDILDVEYQSARESGVWSGQTWIGERWLPSASDWGVYPDVAAAAEAGAPSVAEERVGDGGDASARFDAELQLLEYADKTRMPDWVSQQRPNAADVRNQARQAKSIVERFENAPLSVGDDVANGGGTVNSAQDNILHADHAPYGVLESGGSGASPEHYWKVQMRKPWVCRGASGCVAC